MVWVSRWLVLFSLKQEKEENRGSKKKMVHSNSDALF